MTRARRGPVCGRCKRPVVLALVDGAWVNLDPAEREPELGLVAFVPWRETGKELAAVDVPHPAWAWAYKGVTFHERHQIVCVAAPLARRPGQDRLTV